MDSAQTLDLELNKLSEKVKKASLPADLLEKVNSMLSLLSISLKTGTGSFINYQVTENYLNWLCSLPFNIETQENLDINKAKEILDKNHYGLTSIKDTILEYLSTLILNKQNNVSVNAPILCLVGLVGTGKTTLAYSIAEALGRKFERIPFGGLSDSLSLRGQSRAFSDAEPGLFIKKIVHAQSKNCVILLDELDRIAEHARADVMGVLIEALDNEQNKSFVDHYIDYPFDLSHILFIATANNTSTLSTAVLDRLEIIQMPSYNDEEKKTIGELYLFPKIVKNSGLVENQVIIDEALWSTIIRPLGYDSGIRSLERTLENLARGVAREIVEGKLQKNARIKIDENNINKYLD
ncbi:MAG: hypothetical protein A2798_01025 [Candidatus Levybacteria bacterium RIFCSPHIGHO2_01_FULL_37_17]|nr:MAG: hypothetical protein A2798_01025 [Candidatus Levybacteria bacterium RIFCSPHIGHO2_01_FULL_37_17]OGH37034.1 MAG: hypothetical protein A2959_01885 [Candidatus Levybacteria bacterium RIFCSPLOWO2_01_FULL_38_23]